MKTHTSPVFWRGYPNPTSPLPTVLLPPFNVTLADQIGQNQQHMSGHQQPPEDYKAQENNDIGWNSDAIFIDEADDIETETKPPRGLS